MNEHHESVEARGTIRRATEVVLIDGYAPFDPDTRDIFGTLASSRDKAVIAEASSALAFNDGTRMDWMTLGTPALVFLDGRELIGEIRLLLPDFVRCEVFWDGDAQLIAPQLMANVLSGLGVKV